MFPPREDLLSLYYGSLLNSFLYKVKNPHMEAVPDECDLGCDHCLAPPLFSTTAHFIQMLTGQKCCLKAQGITLSSMELSGRANQCEAPQQVLLGGARGDVHERKNETQRQETGRDPHS